eukprot:s5304_g5.t1
MSLILVSWSGLANRAEAARLSQSIRRSQKDHLLVFVTAEAFSAGFLSVATSFPGDQRSSCGKATGEGLPWLLFLTWYPTRFEQPVVRSLLQPLQHDPRPCILPLGRPHWSALLPEAWRAATGRQRALRSNGVCCKACYGERWKSHRSLSEGFIFWQCSLTAIVMHGAAISLALKLDRHQPVFVRHEVQLVSAGWYHSLATLQTGETVAWGRNNCGQLGDGTRTDRTRPVPVLGPMALEGTKLMNAASSEQSSWLLVGQDHSLAIVQVPGHGKSVVYGWGANVGKPAADEDRFTMVSPDALIVVRILSIAGVEFASSRCISASLHFATPGSCLPGERRSCHTVPVDSNGTVAPQGKNGYGQLGDCTVLPKTEPTKVMNLVRQVVAGVDFSLAVLDSSTVMAFGCCSGGRLGTGGTTHLQAPTPVLEGVKSVVAGHCHCFALLESGECLGWGVNQHGCVRVGGDPEILAPVKVDLKDIVEIKAGDGTTLARLSSGRSLCAG